MRVLSQIPVPSPSAADRAAVESLVQSCLDAKVADPAADDSRPEAEVEGLYFGTGGGPQGDS